MSDSDIRSVAPCSAAIGVGSHVTRHHEPRAFPHLVGLDVRDHHAGRTVDQFALERVAKHIGMRIVVLVHFHVIVMRNIPALFIHHFGEWA